MTTIGKLVLLAILAWPATARGDADNALCEWGTTVSVGAGFTQFTRAEMRDHATEGAAWEGRVALGTKQPISFELGYFGTVYGLDASGLDSRAQLLGTTFEAAMRIPFASGRLQPYLVFGGGWGRYSMTNTMTTTTSDMKSADNITSHSLGGGFMFKRDELVFDLRTVYRVAGHVDLLPARDAHLDAWSTTLSIGIEY